MARQFLSAASEYASTAASILSSYSWTVAALICPESKTGVNQCAVCGKGPNLGRIELGLDAYVNYGAYLKVSKKPFPFLPPISKYLNTGGGGLGEEDNWSVDEWCLVGAAGWNAYSHFVVRCILGDVSSWKKTSELSTTVDVKPSSGMIVGTNATATADLDGRIAWICWWHAHLSDNELKAIAMGVNPKRIRTEALDDGGCWPLHGFQSPEPNIVGTGKSLTLYNTPARADGAPVTPDPWRMWGPQGIDVAAAAAGRKCMLDDVFVEVG